MLLDTKLTLRWFVIGLLTSSAATHGFVGRRPGYRVEAREGPVPAEARTTVFHHDAPGPPPDRSPQERPGPGSSPGPEDSTREAEQPSPVELRASIEQLVAAGVRDPSEYLNRFRELLETGGPEGLEQVLELMQDPEIVFDWRGQTFFEVLKDQDNPSIFPAARDLLAQFDQLGLQTLHHRLDYYRIAAAHGGPEGGEFLLERIDSGGDQAAIRAVAEVADHTLGEAFLERLEQGDNRLANPLAEALASWRDPHVSSRLEAIGLAPESPRRLRETAMKALGENVPTEVDAARLASHYYRAPDPSSRRIALDGIEGMAANPLLDSGAKRRVGEPVVLAALADGDEGVRRNSVGVISDCVELHTPAVARELERLLASHLGEQDRTQARFALGAVRYTLEKKR